MSIIFLVIAAVAGVLACFGCVLVGVSMVYGIVCTVEALHRMCSNDPAARY
jgi:hypothetical protein